MVMVANKSETVNMNKTELVNTIMILLDLPQEDKPQLSKVGIGTLKNMYLSLIKQAKLVGDAKRIVEGK